MQLYSYNVDIAKWLASRAIALSSFAALRVLRPCRCTSRLRLIMPGSLFSLKLLAGLVTCDRSLMQVCCWPTYRCLIAAGLCRDQGRCLCLHVLLNTGVTGANKSWTWVSAVAGVCLLARCVFTASECSPSCVDRICLFTSSSVGCCHPAGASSCHLDQGA